MTEITPWMVGALIFAAIVLAIWAFGSHRNAGPDASSADSGSSDWPLWNSSLNSYDSPSTSDDTRTSDDGCTTNDSSDSGSSDSGSCDSGSDSGGSDSGSSSGE